MDRILWKTVRITRRVFPVLLAMLMLLAFSAQALAAPGKSKNGSDQSKPGTKTGQKGKSDTKSEETEETGETPEQTQTEEKTRYHGISVDKITLAIENVSDETTKTELQSLLDAYTTALEKKDGAISEDAGLSGLAHAASDARKALKDGLEKAGMSLGSVLGWQEWKDWPAGTALDIEQITQVITGLDSLDENKAVLAELLTAYQKALAAEASATDEDRELLAEAVDTAREALLEALYETGVYPVEEAPAEGVETEE
ncbi:MAG: hypothetical protein VB034_10320 [Eubacteriales bacterium]|nr:hypothetical protein [Eubacteriales bacterium]